MTELIITSLTASLWCLGLWTVTEPGKLLAFLKQPLLKIIENRDYAYRKTKNDIIERFQRRSVNCLETDRDYFRHEKDTDIKLLDEAHDSFKKNMKLLNPFILCPICMGSVHGFVCFTMFHPISFWVIPVMVMTAGLNKIWHEKIF